MPYRLVHSLHFEEQALPERPEGEDGGRQTGARRSEIRRPAATHALRTTRERDVPASASRAPIPSAREDVRIRRATAAPSGRRTRWGDPDTLERALRATLADRSFPATSRVARLLVYLVERTIAGESGPLDPACVALDPCDTPPRSEVTDDPALRVLLTRLRRLLHERQVRVGGEQPVLRLCPQGYLAVDLPVTVDEHYGSSVADEAG